ncbi:hypothetical protein JZU46_02450 [bacterium]|nr:hypothetical protein [bacterium]
MSRERLSNFSDAFANALASLYERAEIGAVPGLKFDLESPFRLRFVPRA